VTIAMAGLVAAPMSEMGWLSDTPLTEKGQQAEVCYSTSVSNGNGAVKPKNQMWYSL